jgi:hypothetical protein
MCFGPRLYISDPRGKRGSQEEERKEKGKEEERKEKAKERKKRTALRLACVEGNGKDL